MNEPTTTEVTMDRAERIRSFIQEELLFEDPNRVLALDTPLLEQQVIDSLGLMELVAFLEREFEIEVDDSDITTEHFQTIKDIAELVGRSNGPNGGSAPNGREAMDSTAPRS
jgi:acyl carrier protein